MTAMPEIRPSRVQTQAPGTVINRYTSGSVEVLTPSPFDRRPDPYEPPESSVTLGDDGLPASAVFAAGERPDEAGLASEETVVADDPAAEARSLADEQDAPKGGVPLDPRTGLAKGPTARPAADNTPATTAAAQARKRSGPRKD